MGNTYFLATEKPWHLSEFSRRRSELPGDWIIAPSMDDLRRALDLTSPRYVFFPHWSYIVPPEILERHECVCFHMTDVPYGRGGTPLQNLIVRGHQDTQMTALRMIDELDAGPVYAKRDLSLAGSASDIFDRAAVVTFDLMRWMTEVEPTPHPQQGEATVFKRRRPEQSALPETGGLAAVYDHIRMLDAPGYPPAFVRHGSFRVTFVDAKTEDGAVVAQARIELQSETTTNERNGPGRGGAS